MNWGIVSAIAAVFNGVAFGVAGLVGLRIRAEMERLRTEIADRRLEDRELALSTYLTQAEARAIGFAVNQRLKRLERAAGA